MSSLKYGRRTWRLQRFRCVVVRFKLSSPSMSISDIYIENKKHDDYSVFNGYLLIYWYRNINTFIHVLAICVNQYYSGYLFETYIVSPARSCPITQMLASSAVEAKVSCKKINRCNPNDLCNDLCNEDWNCQFGEAYIIKTW